MRWKCVHCSNAINSDSRARSCSVLAAVRNLCVIARKCLFFFFFLSNRFGYLTLHFQLSIDVTHNLKCNLICSEGKRLKSITISNITLYRMGSVFNKNPIVMHFNCQIKCALVVCKCIENNGRWMKENKNELLNDIWYRWLWPPNANRKHATANY